MIFRENRSISKIKSAESITKLDPTNDDHTSLLSKGDKKAFENNQNKLVTKLATTVEELTGITTDPNSKSANFYKKRKEFLRNYKACERAGINPNNFGAKTELEVLSIETSENGTAYENINDILFLKG